MTKKEIHIALLKIVEIISPKSSLNKNNSIKDFLSYTETAVVYLKLDSEALQREKNILKKQLKEK